MRSATEILADDRLWDLNDVMHYLGKRKSWVYAKAHAKELPSFRVGHEIRFDPEVIKRWARGESV